MKSSSLIVLALLAVWPSGRPAIAQAIADNSFLIEEAYNQERGVVQHISVWQRGLRSAAWAFAFTQEWPLGGQRHQLSYTVPFQRLESPSRSSGFGDAALNYRYQVRADARVALALGAGAWGAQLNLPLSVSLGSSVVTHWNAGLTTVSRTSTYNAGASVIWLARPTFNVMVEIAWADQGGGGAESFVVNPGVRWAHNFASGLQIVPGVAFPIGVGPSKGERSALLYLSFEHRFRSEKGRN